MSTTITDKAGLQAMKDTLDGDFVLGNAIDASGGDFTPVGDNSTPFTGTFDGGDYAITGLTIDHTGNYAGLFGYTNGATISNVTLSSPSVTASGDVVGALVGEADDTTISYITVTGAAIEVADDYAGGLVGIADGTGITKCSFSGAVIGGDSCIGGLIGWLSGTGAVSKCYVAASSTVNGGNYVGGFIGYNSGTGVTDCYTRATVVATNYYSGGFVGYQDSNGIIIDSYSTGIPTAADTPGGFCADNSNTITNCFWDTETSGTEASDGGTGRTTAQMLYITTYTDWDFCFIWNMNLCLNDGYPFLRWTAIDGGGETRTYTLPPIYDEKGRIPKGATARAYRGDTGALVETETLDSSGQATFTELPNDTDVSIHITWGGTTTTHKTEQIHSTIIGVTEGGTGASDEYNARSNLGLGSEDSPQFTAVNLGHATDTTVARTAAGRANIEGVNIVRAPASATDNIIPRFNLTTGDLIQQTGITADDSNNVSGVAKLTTSSDVELGHASDTTIHRESAGLISVEGDNLIRASDVDDTPVNEQTAVPVSSNWAFDHDARDATASVQGHATAAQITKLDALGAGADVVGPASSTDNEIARQHLTTGKILQTYTSNPPTISDTGDMNIDGDLDVENIVVSGNVDGVDVSAHVSRHGYLGADELMLIRPITQRGIPFFYKAWQDINGFTAPHTGSGAFTTGWAASTLKTGVTNNSEGILHSTSGLYQAYGSYGYSWGMTVSIRQTSTQTVWIGLLGVPTAPSLTQAHIAFYVDTSNDIWASSGNGTSGTQTDTGVNHTNTNPLYLSIYGNATGLYFYIGHVLKATHLLASSYYPNAIGCYFTMYIKNATDGATRDMYCYPLNMFAMFAY